MLPILPQHFRKRAEMRKVGIMHSRVPYDGYLEDEVEVLRSLNHSDPTTSIHLEVFKQRISAAYYIRTLASKAAILFHAWKQYVIQFMLLRQDMVSLFRFEHFLRRRFLALRIVLTRERILRKSLRRYCRRMVSMVFYRWHYETRWVSFKLVSRTSVIKALRKNLMTQRMMKLNWRVIVSRKLRWEAARLIQHNFRLHSRFRRTHARIVITRFVLAAAGFYLFCRRVAEERRRMEFESRAAHSFSQTAMVRLDRFIYQDAQGGQIAADYLHKMKKLGSEELARLKKEGSNNFIIIPTEKSIPRIDEQWTLDGKILYIAQYRCSMEAANIGRRRFREDDPPRYWCQVCGEVLLMKRIKEAHSIMCRRPSPKKIPREKYYLITRAGEAYGRGFGGGYICDGLSKVIYDVQIKIPKPLFRFKRREINFADKLKSRSIYSYFQRKPKEKLIEWANDYQVSNGLVSITGSRLTKHDKPLRVAAGPVIYVDAGASVAIEMLENICWKECDALLFEILGSLESAGPPVKPHA